MSFSSRDWKQTTASKVFRLLGQTHIGEGEECWEWTAHRNRGHYGVFSLNGRNIIASRASYLLFVGSISPGYEVHHTCHNPGCINPKHLEALPSALNAHLHSTPAHLFPSHCPNGHRYDLLTRRFGRGYRICRLCYPDTRAFLKPDCPHGHPYIGDNLYLDRRGFRHCRTCDRERTAKRRQTPVWQEYERQYRATHKRCH